jgi:hypothetical protein
MKKLDAKQLLEQAEAAGKIYPMKSGWRKFMWFAVFLMAILVITIPVAIWFGIVAKRGRVGITDEGFAVSWFTNQAYAWEDIESFEQQRLQMSAGGQGGLVGALAVAAASEIIANKSKGLNGPIIFKLKGKRGQKFIPAHSIDNSLEMAQEMEKHTGLAILISEDGKVG